MAGELKITRNSYHGKFVDMKKVEDYAFQRTLRGETTRVHYHAIDVGCNGHEHKDYYPGMNDDDE